jgi:type II secretory pathway component PulJ
MSLIRQHRSRHRQRGLSVVEMMVGVAVGLFVVAAATLVISSQLVENRRLLVETQLQQDLRATADIITRELRRAGARDSESMAGAWYLGGLDALPNTRATVSPTAGSATSVSYRYYRDALGDAPPSSFALDNGVLKSNIAGSGLQDLTDGRVLKITDFSVTPQNGPAIQLPCPKPCADGTQDCWPTVTVRELAIVITGEAANDPSVRRTVRSNVRLRNDWVRFNDPLNPNRICPA